MHSCNCHLPPYQCLPPSLKYLYAEKKQWNQWPTATITMSHRALRGWSMLKKKETRESYILIHISIWDFWLRGSEETSGGPFGLFLYLQHAILNRIFWGTALVTETEGWARASHTFLPLQSPTLHGSPKLWERKYLCLPKQKFTPLLPLDILYFISDSYFPRGQVHTETHSRGANSIFNIHRHTHTLTSTFKLVTFLPADWHLAKFKTMEEKDLKVNFRERCSSMLGQSTKAKRFSPGLKSAGLETLGWNGGPPAWAHAQLHHRRTTFLCSQPMATTPSKCQEWSSHISSSLKPCVPPAGLREEVS